MSILRKILLLVVPISVFAQAQYTVEEVTQHNVPGDCWMIFEDSVYDFSEYLPEHDKFMDIREWCGEDMTEDFKDKAGIGRDHKEFTYDLLEDYYIGQLVIDEVLEDPQGSVSVVNEEIKSSTPYNLFVPLFLTLAVYWITYFVFRKKHLNKYNAFWNTVLLLTFVIPSFGFGIFMMLRYRFPKLREIDFEFMYWHVELSVVMSAIALSHFIQRIKQYLVQFRK